MKINQHSENRKSYEENSKEFFFNTVDMDTIRKGIVFLDYFLLLLPVLISFIGRPLMRMLHVCGDIGPDTCMVVGNFWYLMVQFLGIGAGLLVLLAVLSKKRNQLSLAHSGTRNKKIYSQWLPLNMTLLFLWAVISSFLSESPEDAVMGDDYYHAGLFLLICGLLFALTGSWLSRKQMKGILECLVAICAVTGIYVLLDDTPIFRMLYLEKRYMLMFHHHNHYGYFLATCAPLAMGIYLQQEKKKQLLNLVRILELWLIFNAMAVNSTRGSFVAVSMILGCWNIYVFVLKKNLKKKVLFLDVLYVLTFLFLNTGSTLLHEMVFLGIDIASIVNHHNEVDVMNQIGSRRGLLWRYGLQFAREKPLFGYGLSNLMAPYKAEGIDTYSPHNCLILLAASLGIPAVTFYVSGLTAHLIGFFRYVKKMSVLEVTIYASVGAYLISSFFGSWIYYTTPYYFLMLGFSYGVYKRHLHMDHSAS